MPAKKEEAKAEEKAVKKAAPKAAKKAPAKKPAAKKAPAKKTVAAKKEAPKAAPALVSKGQARKRKIENKFDGREYQLGIGKRKSAVAQVRIHSGGKGQIWINDAKFEDYFFGTLIESTLLPLTLTGNEKNFDITVKVTGGGISSQADAVRHGIARALEKFQPELRATLKPAGLLTRDSRTKERKKPGLRGARRSPQWSKR